MTLHDHFHDKAALARPAVGQGSGSKKEDDRWALQFIHVHWLGAIVEAIDDDHSGFITITELNKFTDDLPLQLEWR